MSKVYNQIISTFKGIIMQLQSSLSATRMKTLAFGNSTYSKTEAVALAEQHRLQDSYLQGTYGKDTPKGWRGCSVGCMAQGKHDDYPELFGIDARIAHLSDVIFESLPSPDYKDWTVKLFESVQEGIDTKQVWYRFTYWMLADAEHGVYRYSQNPAIIAVAELFRKAAQGAEVSQEEWKAVDNTAHAAAARAAIYAARAYIGAYAYAARAYAAADAADAACAARTKHYQLMADSLCYFLAGGV
jgi:hypothetical protein